MQIIFSCLEYIKIIERKKKKNFIRGQIHLLYWTAFIQFEVVNINGQKSRVERKNRENSISENNINNFSSNSFLLCIGYGYGGYD